MVTAWRMNDWAGIRYIFAHRFKSAISQFLVTMLATVVFDLTVAIILGVIYSAILYVARSSRIHVAFSTIDGNRLRYDVGKSPILDSAGVVYVTGSLFFGAVDEFNHRLQDIPEEDHLILSLRGMPSVDVSGAQAVLELCQRLLAKGHTIAFCGVAEDVRSTSTARASPPLVGESAYYHSADRAILALLDEGAARGIKRSRRLSTAAQAGGILESFHGLYYHPCPPFATGAFVERRRTRSKRVAAFIFVKIDKTENLQIDLLAIFPFFML